MSEETEIESGVGWTHDIDAMLASWCDHAKCYEWMHSESFSYYDMRAKQFMISVNCLTAVSGVSNVIAGGYSFGGFQIAWIFGGISILASTLNIIQDKLGYQASSVLHKRICADWSAIRRELEQIMVIPYGGRKDCKSFLKFIKNAINRALDGVTIPKHIREACYKKFNSIREFDIPDICGKVEHTRVFIGIKQPLLGL
jgi:hypothetical protein